MSKLIRHDSCPSCGSANNLAVYDDHEYCFGHGCEHYRNYNGDNAIAKESKAAPVSTRPITPLPEKEMPAIKSRGIDSSTVNKYKVSVNTNPDNTIEAVFPRFNTEHQHIANQIRYKDKDFSSEGPVSSAALFGQPFFPAGGRSVTVTEGYYDTLAAFQMTGSRYPNVGVQSATSAKKEFVNNFEWLNSFDEIVINFDSDEPGQSAAKEVAQLFTPGKIKILKLQKAKDANDYLMQDLVKDYINEWFRAPHFMPDGLKLGTEMWDDIKNHKTPKSIPYPWAGLNSKTYGIRRSELVLLTAPTGVGKTSIFKELEYSMLMNAELQGEKAGVGFLHLEEPKYDTAIGLMSIHHNKPYHLPDTERSEEELRKAYDEVINTERVVIWDHFGSNDIDVVLAKIRHMAALGCRYIMVDHLSIIVSDQSGDERKQLDEISTKIKTLTMNLDIACLCVIHVNRQGQVRGSAGPEQVANIVLRLERDLKDPDPWRRNITTLSIEKNRFCGRTGPACHLFYNEITNRLEELTTELSQEFENGGNAAGHEFDTFA
jgi:twinkle protein